MKTGSGNTGSSPSARANAGGREGSRAAPSRREVLRTGLIGGVAIYLAPLGSPAYAALFAEGLLTAPAWNGRDGVLRYRIDGVAKVTGEKVFARDIRARDMPHWPALQAHALVLRVTKADRIYAGFDLSVLDPDLKPDRVVTAADLARDGLVFPAFYGDDMLLPEGRTPAYLGQAVAILIYYEFARFRFAKYELRFNEATIHHGAVTGPLRRDPRGSSRVVRVGGKTPYDADLFSPMAQGMVFPAYRKHIPIWPNPARTPSFTADIGAEGMRFADAVDDELAHPPADWLILTRNYVSQSADTAALEPDNANGWYDAAKRELHLVVPTQSPQEVAESAATMLAQSRLGVRRLFLHPCFTVGYGSKDHCNMPFYGLVAAIYGGGRPVRLANDRFEQFQTGLKRHEFRMRYTMAVERQTGKLQSFRAGIVANGGGRANCSAFLVAVGATAAQSIYYFLKSDLTATAIASRAVDAGSARGYGALETMTASELMVDEIAATLGLDPIAFRRRNVMKSGMKNTQGAIPAGAFRGDEVLEKAQAHTLWTGRAARKVAFDAAHPGKYYGVGFACIQRDFGIGAESSLAKVELAPDGRITLYHTGTEIGTGASSAQPVACVRWLGRPADAVHMAVTEWSDLPVETSGNPHAMSQAEQDCLEKNPRWSPAYASASSASNSAFYFTHTTREAARMVFRHGLWPAALALWGTGIGGGQAASLVVRPEDARWTNGYLTADGMQPLPLALLTREAHARGLIVGAAVHAFNRWEWAEASFTVNGVPVRAPVDGLSIRYGDGAAPAKRALLTTPGGYQVLDRQDVFYPPTQRDNARVTYYSTVATLAEIAIDAATGTVALLSHHTIVECGNTLVPELVSGQIQGGTAMGIGHALHEYLPLYEDGPGNGPWNFNRYPLPRGSDVAVWTQTTDVLPPLSDTDPQKGMAEVTMIPVVAAIVNAITHATGHRFRELPVTAGKILGVLA
jgi:CO/xanthine dehydrogenase Mo-binding subunit